METHQGVLEIEREVGVGTTVTARFPRERLMTAAPAGETEKTTATA